uniref:Reverse transcriptase Ty1/copia-type domain-containing protein n=1 Tax=Cuerna arida TaxID=1464854 RepID=A0A1B6FTN5_9HEMI
MERESFNRSQNDTCLYYRFSNGRKLYLLIYVDDLIIVGSDLEEVISFKSKLSQYFKMKDVRPVSTYLGIKVEHNLSSGVTTLNQTDYLKQVLERFGMTNCKSVSTPMDANFRTNLKNVVTGDKGLERKCRSLIGCLMYAMLGSRPDLCYPISFLSRFQDRVSEELWSALKRILRYIKGTLELNLVYRKGGNLQLEGFVDADWAGDAEARHSTSGYLFRIGSATVSWSSKRQTTVALSSTEAEYVALSFSVTEACFIRKILKDLRITQPVGCPTTIFEDNQSAIQIANSEENKRLKHVAVRFHYVKEKLKDGTVMLQYISTQDQLADILTKPLGRLSFQKLREGCGLE